MLTDRSNDQLYYLHQGGYPVLDAARFDDLIEVIHSAADGEAYAFLVDDAVVEHYSVELSNLLRSAPCYSPRDRGENVKTFTHWRGVQDWLWRIEFPRKGLLVSIGGGALLDLGGFVSATFRRGIRHLRVGTTLLADVDAALGVKCGLTEFGRKNSVGAFHAPEGAIICEPFMRSLPEREYAAGVAELIKTGLCVDAKLWSDLQLHYSEQARPSRLPWSFVRRGSVSTAVELDRDLWETRFERPLDLGHTISPAIESDSGELLLHGEAVAIDLCFSAAVGYQLGVVGERFIESLFRTVSRARLRPWLPWIDLGLIRTAVTSATLHRGGSLNMPIVEGDGGSVQFMQEAEVSGVLEGALDLCQELSSSSTKELPL